MSLRKGIRCLICVLVCVPVAWPARALTIENKSAFAAIVLIKDESFRKIARVRIPAKTAYQYLEAGREKEIFNLESYIEDPADTVGVPTFHHHVKFRDSVCVPLHLCVEKPAKK